jgi:membrane protein YqaA with SNARE-associated domain
MFDPLLLFGAVFLVNVIPAFMPPTWMLLSLFAALYGVPVLDLVVIGAVASTSGRYVLARASGPLGDRFLPRKQKKSIKYLKNFLSGEPWTTTGLVSFLYSLSPLPSNTMFIVTGAARISLVPVLGGFFIGRLISYAVLTSVAINVVSAESILNPLLNPAYLVMDIIGLAAAVGLLLIDWRHFIHGTIENEKKRRAEEGMREVFKGKGR